MKSDAHQVHGRFRDSSDFAWTQSLPSREEEDFLLALRKSPSPIKPSASTTDNVSRARISKLRCAPLALNASERVAFRRAVQL